MTEPSHAFRSRLQLIFFLVLWPGINLLLMSTILQTVGYLQPDIVAAAALRLWGVSIPSLLLIRVLENRYPSVLHPDKFLRQIALHLAVIMGFGLLGGSFVQLPVVIPLPVNLFVPRVVVALEIILYLSVLRILRLQERSFEASARIREAELNVLRAQSNPHFLFNTLNLITAEITKDPESAREIVFDLSDLLRSNVRMAQQSMTSLAEEMELVSLYLKLQQRRFKDRLHYTIDVAQETRKVRVPSLLLQPVVENTIKWAVAPYAAAAHLSVETRLAEKALSIVFKDSGPPFDPEEVVEGNGMRILRQTLELHYPGEYEVQLQSTTEGGKLSIRIPAQQTGGG